MNRRPGIASAGAQGHDPLDGNELVRLFRRTRERTERLAAPLSAEDQLLQSMPAASPTKWHRAHTTWFFETFLLEPEGISPVHPRYRMLFNSYYEGIGPRPVRAWRGLLSRPSFDEVAAYRRAVDDRLSELLLKADDLQLRKYEPLVLLGVAHEEQHQELILTDILHAFSRSPELPAYTTVRNPLDAGRELPALHFVHFEGGQVTIGAGKTDRFFFDNEQPRHDRWVEPFSLANRLVTVGELKRFIADGGYRTPTLWLSDGWDFVRANNLEAPLYSRLDGGTYVLFGLTGERAVTDDQPAVHLSFYEADALATWMGARLPTEAEWETAACGEPLEGNFLDNGPLHALPCRRQDPGLHQLFGDAWEWTRSSYEPYPRYRPAAGAIGEYNGKFMVNQIVLRGGSCFTPEGHIRPSYRNFWPPDTRHQMTGVRLARDL
jgi:ergothioneine biosynthesis protein EgtB